MEIWSHEQTSSVSGLLNPIKSFNFMNSHNISGNVVYNLTYASSTSREDRRCNEEEGKEDYRNWMGTMLRR